MKKINQVFLIFCVASVITLVLFALAQKPQSKAEMPTFADEVDFDINGEACALVDASSGEILFEKNSNKRMPMASTTKIMTAIVVLERLNVEKTVVISKNATGIEGSSIYLEEGEKLTAKELLYGLLLESGNDAATALAIECGGSEEGFVKLMNQKAHELRLVNTRFENPHGLSAKGHYTTAAELAKIAAYAMKNKLFCTIVATKSYAIPQREGSKARYFVNHNRLLDRLPGCDGIKTGYTLASGRCLVSSIKRGDSRFICVTLNDRNDWNDHKRLLSYAADGFESILLAKAGELHRVFFIAAQDGRGARRVEVKNCEDIYVTVKRNTDRINVRVEIDCEDCVESDVAGRLLVEVGERQRSFPLVVSRA